MSTLIKARDVHFSYGKVQALRGIDLSIQKGEVVAILGPNGAGKTTFIETLMGSIRPDQGDIFVLGKRPIDFSAQDWSRIGMVQQHWKDHEKWLVEEHLRWIQYAHQSVGAETIDPHELLRQQGLADKWKTKLSSLSGGQRRRVDFIAAMISKPSLILLDEPTTGLDPEAKAAIHDIVGASADAGTTVVLTTHDLTEAEKLASRILIIKDGKAIANATVPELRDQLVRPAQIVWKEDGRRYVHATYEVEQYVKTLDLDRVSRLTISRPTLEDAYLALVNGNNKHEETEAADEKAGAR
ncbi:MAG: ABC transporter ATP-binding protein [Acidobacteriota bacterium]|nr:ABC transporter ATP-binding protein [Acidobacteriota bacterium]